MAADNKNDLFDLSPLTRNHPPRRVQQGNNHAVSLPEINRAFNIVIKLQAEIWMTVVS